jgi:murein L,D-transpeptidase YcbB/YkuD
MNFFYCSRRNFFTAILYAAFLCTTSCVQPPVIQKSQSIALPKPGLRMPADSAHAIYSSLKHPGAVYKFYLSVAFDLKWANDSGTLPDSLLSFVKSVRLYGLLPQDYHTNEFVSPPGIDTTFVYRREALLTDAFLSLVTDLKFGRMSIGQETAKDSLSLIVLEDMFKNNRVKEVLEGQEPLHKQYVALKKSLDEILNGADTANLRLLLAGTTIDSIDLHKKVQQIEINMDRWRSEMPQLDQRCVWINIPSYQLVVVENDQAIIESKIIVGRPESPTPILSSTIECITLYPYWYIPRKIAIAEYLSVIQKDTTFLRKNNLDVLDRAGNVLQAADVNWQKFTTTYFPVSLRQREGPGNSLGVIKFIFDNPYAVFLHDTNAKNLFQKKARAFSHGCIRMEKAVDLAKYLSGNPKKVDSQLQLKKRYTINLTNPISIYTRYFTCAVIDDKLIFYKDVYGLDSGIIDFLYQGRGSE